MKTAKKEDQAWSIDENLRKVFDETLEQGVPDRFKVLLEQLKDQDAARDQSK